MEGNAGTYLLAERAPGWEGFHGGLEKEMIVGLGVGVLSHDAAERRGSVADRGDVVPRVVSPILADPHGGFDAPSDDGRKEHLSELLLALRRRLSNSFLSRGGPAGCLFVRRGGGGANNRYLDNALSWQSPKLTAWNKPMTSRSFTATERTEEGDEDTPFGSSAPCWPVPPATRPQRRDGGRQFP